MRLFTLLILLLQGISLQAQTTYQQTIRGTVTDEDTKSPVIGAYVIILNSDPLLGTTTDIDGKFKIENVPVGRQAIKLSYIGYEDKVIPNLLVGSGKELVLDLTMMESFVELKTVEISGTDNKAEAINEMALVSARSFSVEETKRFAAGIGDPARLMTAYAGVTGNGGDDQNAIIIRGNSPRGLLWRLEGIEIPNPNHFASEGASSGGVSILSTNTLSNSDFYTGAFPAEFGNALSGAFDIKLRNGNNEKREYAFQASMLGVEAALEGPFQKGKNASYLVNYRYSTLGLFNAVGIRIVSEDDITTYQDAAFKLNFPTKKAGVFSVHGIGGISSNKYRPSGSQNNTTNNADVGALGFKHLYLIGKKSFINSYISLSGTRVTDEGKDITPEYTYESTEEKSKSFIRVGTKLRNKFNSRHILESGVVYSRLAYNFRENETTSYPNAPTESLETLNEKGNSGTLQAYSSWKYRITEHLSFINGFHVLYFALNQKAAIEPRSALKWQFTSGQSIGVGFGVHSRIESLEYYLARTNNGDGTTNQPNKNLDFTKARHYVISYDNVLSENWYIKAETYYQQLFDVPVHHRQENIFSTLLLEDGYIADTLVNQGTGTNYGVELTVQRFFNKGFYLLMSGSLYEAKYQAIDGKTRNTPFNSNFGLNLLTGKEFAMGQSKQNMLGFNLRASWGGNRRYIPINLEVSQVLSEEVSDFSRAYENRLPDYWKIDFQLNYRVNRPKVTHVYRLDILNVTNRLNVASQFYNAETGRIENDTQPGIIPAVGYRIEF